ncbi:MAG: signal peptidase II [Bacilli bacterium]
MTLIPNFLYLTYTRNTGGAWSILSGNMAFLAVISAVAFIVIFLFYLKNLTKQNTLKRILFAVILAGTLGNFIDRAFYKLFLGSEGVVDFIHFRFGTYDFPIFNVADILLTVGIITFGVLITVEDFKNKKLSANASEIEEGNTDEHNQDSKRSEE